MYEYNNNNFDNREQSAQHYDILKPDIAPTVRAPKKRKSSGLAARAAKKIGAITLSAVLFGGVASGTFLAVNKAAGYSPAASGTASASGAADGAAAASHSSALMQTTSIPGNVTVNGSLDVTDIASAVMPSIVSITNKSVQEVQTYFNRFGYGFQTQAQETESCGSGIIIGKNDSELLIVTNYHVIEDADTLSACFIDSQAYEANVKGTDPDNDLAVIAIGLESISEDTMSQIAVASIGDSDSLKVGEQVVAIGNALGYGQSVTTGIVSATNRSFTSGSSQAINTSTDVDDTPTYIQTDAAINPGNSGGALVNMKGEVIGINSAKIASNSVEGMGYAIPVSRVSNIIETLMNETTRTRVAESQRSSIGISGITVNESVSQTYGIPEGVYVAEVTEGSGAEAAGIVRGEVITKFDGKAVTDISELQNLLQYYAAGETVEVTLKVPNAGEYTEKTVSLTLGQAAAASEAADTSNATLH